MASKELTECWRYAMAAKPSTWRLMGVACGPREIDPAIRTAGEWCACTRVESSACSASFRYWVIASDGLRAGLGHDGAADKGMPLSQLTEYRQPRPMNGWAAPGV